MEVVVRQHPFYFEVHSVPCFYTLWWVKKKKQQERKGKTLWSQGLQS